MTKSAKAEGATTAIDTTGFVEEALGIPPYWHPSEDKNDTGNHGRFFARLVDFDGADPKMPRWVFQAKNEFVAHSGPREDQTQVRVKEGDLFTVAHRAQFRNLAQYMGLEMLVTATHKSKLPGNKTLWNFTVQLPKEQHVLLESRRAQALADKQLPRALPAVTIDGEIVSE